MSPGIAMSKAGTVSVARGLRRTNGWLQLTQFIAFRNTMNPAGLPSGADETLKRTEVVHKS